MQSISTYGSRAARREFIFTVTAPSLNKVPRWICAECRLKLQSPVSRPRTPWQAQRPSTRWISTATRLRQPDRQSSSTINASTSAAISSEEVSGTENAPELPSTAARSRSDLSNRLTRIADSILARASVAGQHINVYTGTDYSGIQTLREDIIAQESRVKVAYHEVESAKEAHHEEVGKQAGAQKEIVGLLERKASWSPTDLERYMSLVRSEHVNDQAVQNAKRTLDASERELEEARQLLERLERKQYHEEQVWSDTIRRNSTWVTFGLMGVNILLLLGQILLFEPMRRKRIVRDLREALDEKTMHGTPGESTLFTADAPTSKAIPETVPKQADSIVDPVGSTVERLEFGDKPPPGTGDQPLDLMATDDGIANSADAHRLTKNTFQTRWLALRRKVLDFFSDHAVQLKQVDITSIALQSAAAGALSGALAVSALSGLLRRP